MCKKKRKKSQKGERERESKRGKEREREGKRGKERDIDREKGLILELTLTLKNEETNSNFSRIISEFQLSLRNSCIFSLAKLIKLAHYRNSSHTTQIINSKNMFDLTTKKCKNIQLGIISFQIDILCS